MKNGRPRSQKGSSFERGVCAQLSLWWSKGESDSVFYRTGGSGGRATRRGRKGKQTVNHCGDVQASDPSGMPLLKLCTIELKRGFNTATLHDVLDAPAREGRNVSQKWQQWIDQAIESAKHAGSMGWMIVARRDKRRAACFMPESVFLPLFEARETPVAPLLILHPHQIDGTVYGVRLDDLLASVDPDDVRDAVEMNA